MKLRYAVRVFAVCSVLVTTLFGSDPGAMAQTAPAPVPSRATPTPIAQPVNPPAPAAAQRTGTLGQGATDLVGRELSMLKARVVQQGSVSNRLVGGQDFALQAGPTGNSAQLTWLGGTGQTGYLVIRLSPSGQTFLPAGGLLGPNEVSFVDAGPLTQPFYFYILLTFGTEGQLLAVSDALGLLPGASGGASSPGSFQVRLSESGAATLTWTSASAATARVVRGQDAVTRFVLAAAPASGTGSPRTTELGPNDHVAVDQTGGVPTCYLLLAYAGQVLVGNTGVLCAFPGISSPRSAVKVNEVESSGGVPGDWIELYNTSTTPVSLVGYVVRDSDDTHTYTIPAGATIPPLGFYVVEEAALGFGLGASDAARLFAPGGTNLLDSYVWTQHAATTYGRCPDGTGAFQTTTTVTKGAPNDCSVPVVINEIESNQGVPGDWVELFNPGSVTANLTGFVFKDNDDTHVYAIPAGTTIAPGGYFVLEEAAFVFGLGSGDAARLFRPDGTLADSYVWAAHATTTYGRCPNGTGPFTTTTSVTKGAANDCSVGGTAAIKINEIESSGGTPGDWVELFNTSASAVDLSGFVFRDDDDTHNYVIPASTTIAGNGYYVLEGAAFVFGLGAPDAARLFAPDGTTLVDSYAWTAHATTTYGRCPNGTGPFTTTTVDTKGSTNACPGVVTAAPWPGSPDIQIVDGNAVFGGNLSGLTYESSGTTQLGTLWGVRNKPSTLFRLIWNGTIWTADPTNDWGAGKDLRYPDGTGDPDSEGVTFTTTVAGGMYVATERNNSADATSRPAILRFDPNTPGATLTATNDWNLTADLPPVGANLGIEGIAFLPDQFLTSKGFFDESKSHVYNPAEYPNHGAGLFFVGLEVNGMIYAYALNHSDNSFARIATFASGFPAVMDLAYDRVLNYLWAVCDDTCNGRTAILEINAQGRFVVTHLFERPAAMPNINNEGFTMAAQTECDGGFKPAYWADDSETSGHAIRRGTVPCAPF